ncbi:MAG: recombinase family protein [Oscillospiraceae bacterium]|nr:recombinase family protein [Oscillospiraceae bacterium]
MQNDSIKTYRAALYARISREDGDKTVSDSIVNQLDLIKEYIKSNPEIEPVSERADDGYSGVMFDRPGLNAMLDDVKSGRINCIVVKDLSRFGRNYIEVGRYIRTLFPLFGVRFIAINDGYDSANDKNYADNYIIPFKNIINDAYCADISKKVRSQLEVKRKKGDYIGALVPFGYLKSPENKNKLIVDEAAAEVVKDIFKWKTAGMSQQSIAEKLNAVGVLSPLEYKKSIGLGCSSAFKINPKAKWSAVSVKRILCDEVYTGALIQGKTTTPNYKIKKKFLKEKSDWARVENAHEAIIVRQEFELVEDLLGRDSYKTEIYPFSGMLFCPKCGQNLIRKVSTVDGVKYINHACLKKYENDKRDGCSGIRIKENALLNSVTAAIKNQINTVLDTDEVSQFVGKISKKENGMKKLQKQIGMRKSEREKLINRKLRLYEDYSDGDITRNEYEIFRQNYDLQIDESDIAFKNLQKELDKFSEKENQGSLNFTEVLLNYENLNKISRELIVKLIGKIIVFGGGRIEIIFRCGDEYTRVL